MQMHLSDLSFVVRRGGGRKLVQVKARSSKLRHSSSCFFHNHDALLHFVDAFDLCLQILFYFIGEQVVPLWSSQTLPLVQVMMPELYKLQDEKPYIRIVKFNCNKENKELVRLTCGVLQYCTVLAHFYVVLSGRTEYLRPFWLLISLERASVVARRVHRFTQPVLWGIHTIKCVQVTVWRGTESSDGQIKHPPTLALWI